MIIQMRMERKVDGKTLYPKTGDILLIEGNTLHSSNNNNTDNPKVRFVFIQIN